MTVLPAVCCGIDNNGYMTVIYPFYFQYEVQPSEENPDYGELAGAIATVIVFAENRELGQARASRTIGRHQYRIRAIKRSMVVQSHHVEHMDGGMKALYSEAEQKGIAVVIDSW